MSWARQDLLRLDGRASLGVVVSSRNELLSGLHVLLHQVYIVILRRTR